MLPVYHVAKQMIDPLSFGVRAQSPEGNRHMDVQGETVHEQEEENLNKVSTGQLDLSTWAHT